MISRVRLSSIILTQRLSSIASARRQSTITKQVSATMTEKYSSSESPPTHYNDWPNAVGFDAVYEEHEPVELSVQGHIPAYAAGTLFRTGIGPRSVIGDDGKLIYQSQHWFDGFSQVHRFQLHASTSTQGPDAGIEKITYNSRLSSDALLTRIKRTGKMEDFTFARAYEPCKSFFQKVQSVFTNPTFQPNEVNNAVTMSINYPGLSSTGASQHTPHDSNTTTTLCNRTDTSRVQFLDPETLKPTGLTTQTNLHPLLKGALSAAHPVVDPKTGDTYNYNMDFAGQKATYRVFRTSASTGKTTILTTFQHAGAYLHSLFNTERFIILCVWNSHFTKSGVSILWQRNILDAMYFNKDAPAMWYVIDRRCPETGGGKGVVAKFESDPFFSFHTVNAYEVPAEDSGKGKDEVDIVADITAYPNTDVIHHYYMDNITSSHPAAQSKASAMVEGRYDHIRARLRRYRLPSISLPNTTTITTPQSGKALMVFEAPPSDSPELPTYNPLHNTKPHQYIYGILGPSGAKSTFVDGLIKYDTTTQTAMHWSERGHTAGEAMFIPDPAGTNEDDGVLLSVVLNGYTSKSYLLALDPKTMKEVGRAGVDGVVGFGFHGVHTPIIGRAGKN